MQNKDLQKLQVGLTSLWGIQ